MKTITQACQGDVMTEKCDPEAIEGLKPTRAMLAEGESTGHHHTFHGKNATGFYKEGDNLEMAGGTPLAEFVKIGEGGDALTHQEHGPITHSEGVYIKTPQVEYTPEELRRVAD